MNHTQTDPALAADFGHRWMNTLFEAFLARTGALGDLDRGAGDGDFGTNIASALRRARSNIDDTSAGDYTSLLTALSRGFLGTGGTSGPLFGMFFREMARCTTGAEPTLGEFSRGLAAGVTTVQHYGKAEVGHRTMVDALAPAAQRLDSLVETGPEPADALAQAAQTAVQGARGTADLVARRGRASYVGEVSRGVLDPGATAAAIVLQAAAAAQADPCGRVDASWIGA